MTARLALASLLFACGFEQSNAIDLAPVEGMPVELKNVRMAESFYALIGERTASFSSTDDANAIGVAWDTHVVGKAADYSGTSAKLVCRVGEHTIASRLATDANNQLASAPVGTKFEHRDTFPPTPFAEGIPTVCESTIYYTVAPPLPPTPNPAPAHEFHELGTVCFSDGKLADGACSPDVLPRVPADKPLVVSNLVGRVGTLGEGGHGLQVSVLVTTGETIPDDFMIGADASCRVGDSVREMSLQLLMFARHIDPGESFWQTCATPPGSAMETEPEWCTVDVRVRQNGVKERLAQYCIRGTSATEGACE